MNFKKILFILLFPSFVFAGGPLQTSVPFDNISLTPGSTIEASYNFGQFPIIFCYENNLQTVGIVIWPFQGSLFTSTLPITFVTNTEFQGDLADPTGTIAIFNNQTTTLLVSCDFAF